MRLFVAIQLSDELKKAITGTMHDLKKAGIRGNYVPAQNLHLTIAFIGETDDPAAVKAALQKVSCKPFRLSLSDMGTFGDLLWVGAKGNQGLSAAVKAVRSALDAVGISYDREKFTPHITIVRKVSGNWKKIPAPKGEMKVTKLSLMKTTFKDGKPVYSEVCSVL
ncbi:MAG: RNA 2',3'-cyclic phosphodiesterase [Eubacterium sp.]|nr:RNA 2',3'-cyclic phosphodiesterase [Eubacterium sp.]